MIIYTIGHSTRSLEDIIDILKYYNIELLIDIRRLPGSNKFPHFNKEIIETELPKNNILYIHFPDLGGFRKEGYATFVQTQEFSEAVKKLLEIINDKTVAIMCAEWNVMKCHRWYVSECISNMGYQVFHIINKNSFKEHSELPKKTIKLTCDKKAKTF